MSQAQLLWVELFSNAARLGHTDAITDAIGGADADGV